MSDSEYGCYNAAMNSATPPDTLSVSQLNRLAKQLLEDCFAQVQVSGELSTLSRPSSGHWYFTLKDQRAQIRCAFFKNRNMRVNFQPEPGQQVTVRGKVSLYEGRGDYQLIVDSMDIAGAGALAAAFEQLKQELKEAGWFDAENKQALPSQIQHIAVVTSPTGAAIQDILAVLQRRWPAMKVSILPVMVQGKQAAGQIAEAIATANRWVQSAASDFDVVLLSRGGGSLEDLWPFNERIVAQAIRASHLPVISAVGHEVDFSISDFVADVRAPTPSAAAELLSPDQQTLLSNLNLLGGRLIAAQNRRLSQWRQRCLELRARLKDPRSQLREQSQRLDDLELRLQGQWRQRQLQRKQQLAALEKQLALLSPQRQLGQKKRDLVSLQSRLLQAWPQTLQSAKRRHSYLQQQLQTLGPEQTLQRGYAIVLDSEGQAVRDTKTISAQQKVSARFAKGRAELVVQKIQD
ncbi:Exodeoxyribonuclease VII large subunit [Spongiibacter sp. IMCC21906]|uniref:exodeoxyribonuclease VII large subunit n=1 Tax=Spongiibacter sp. IMCC21906 TaxID=1620392 RepID=UPI00062DFB5B|nr:exodeoxyribonuclease VII large subunit [Spongiibacter sp. IMCC21906]AKH69548.1 Exodeoxyribonuclease VII large subunit [Spongiibacter sp. IMCC21906]